VTLCKYFSFATNVLEDDRLLYEVIHFIIVRVLPSLLQTIDRAEYTCIRMDAINIRQCRKKIN